MTEAVSQIVSAHLGQAKHDVNKLKYREDIDGLRAVAVLSVIFFHFKIFIPRFDLLMAPGGFVGVDIFFVISGYLITKIIYDGVSSGSYSITDFYNRRVRRIFPALFVVFAFCIAMTFFVDFPSEFADTGKSIVASIFFVSNIFFYNSFGYFDQRAAVNPLLHTWSLSVEEQFYLIFPILVLSLRHCHHNTRVRVLVAAMLLSLSYSTWKASVEPGAAFYLVQSRAWELLIGALLAIGAVPKILTRLQGEVVAICGLALIVGSILLISEGTPFPGLAALGPCLRAAAIIHSGAALRTWTGRLLASFPLRFVGLISYSLYLWHWPIIVLSRSWGVPGNRERYLLIGICIILASISWRFVERPFRERPYRLGVNGTLAAGGAVMIAASAIVFIAFQASTKLWNVSARAEEILAYSAYDSSGQMREGTCFLTPTSEVFKKEDCLALKPDRKNFLIIGDSHAADLWPGFQAAYPNVNFLQATASGCKPVLGTIGARWCTDLFEFVLKEFLPSTHLDGIIISAQWNALDIQKLKMTASALLPYTDRMFVAGPIVEYDQSLPRLLALAFGSDDAKSVAGHRLLAPQETDRVFAEAFSHEAATYLSIYQAVCNPECAIWANEKTPLLFDTGHLTREGSILVASRLASQVFPERPRER